MNPGSAPGGGEPLVLRVASAPGDWAQALAIRLSVFVWEQGVPLDEELDAHDPDAVHVLAIAGQRAVGCGRLYAGGDAAVIGRMAVLPGARGRGVGGAILRELLARAGALGFQRATLAAQLHARPFYARFGFVADGPHFLDGGILHQRMERSL
jgi:predicted GNAT family N-acyltransferase